MILDKPLDQVVEKDLLDLIQNQIREQKLIDYKKELKVGSPSEKKEFLADTTSFANADGGMLIIGMKEQEGMPTKIFPLNVDMDKEISRLENILRDGIVPRISGLRIKPVTISSGGFVILIRIPNSFLSPHMVKFMEHNKFYSRNSNGKYLLDYTEVRNLFLQGSEIGERVRKFRFDRLVKINNGETPVSFLQEPNMILHIIPLSNWRLGRQLDLRTLESAELDFTEIGGINGYLSFNFDGAFTKFEDKEYAQIFRDGSVEFTSTRYFKQIINNEKVIPMLKMEREIVNMIDFYTNFIGKVFDTEPPICVFLAFMNVKNCVIPNNDNYGTTKREISQDNLILQEIVLESSNNIVDNLKPLFDVIYNSAGIAGSYHYDEKGKWTGEQEWLRRNSRFRFS